LGITNSYKPYPKVKKDWDFSSVFCFIYFSFIFTAVP
jgi:hypothetical protein